MNNRMKIVLLAGYGLLRLLPFVLTTYLLLCLKTRAEGKGKISQKLHRYFAIFLGWGINGAFFLGMHYLQYNNFTIIGYVKNIWGLNFYHQDVEYFALSVFTAILISLIAGILLRAFFAEGNEIWTLERTQEKVIVICGCTAFLVLLTGMGAKDYFQSQIILYEIAANNQTTKLAEEVLDYDYIELMNTGVLPCRIEDLFLSDDEYELQKMALKGTVIPGKGILMLPCQEGLNSFALNKKGETVYLSDADGQVLDKVTFEEMDADMAYVRVGETFEKWETGQPTPGSHNEETPGDYVKMPQLSHESGFYKEAFELELKAEEGVAVYYTLDGSVPDESSYLYEDTITVYDKSAEPNVWRSVRNVVPDWQNYTPDETPVTKAFIVRALAMDNEGNKSDVVTASYFINCEKYKDKNIISLIADPYDLFENVLGIYVTGNAYDEWYLNGQQGDAPTPLFKMSGMESERKAVFELFTDLESVTQQNVGIRIQGASARETRNKRFSIYARKMYDNTNRLDVSFFERDTQPHSIVLRDVFADVICQELMSDREIPMQQGEDIRLFLNGEYWYDSFVREKYSMQYFEDYYGIEKDQLMVFKSGSLDEGVETDVVLYNELYRFAEEEDFTKQEVYDEFCEMMDVPCYIDFLASNIYCANMDVDDIKNVVLWRSREKQDDAYGDGRWRPALYDMDAVEWADIEYYGVSDVAQINSFCAKPQYAGCAFNEGVIYKALRKNEAFNKQFVNTFMDLMNENFSLKNVDASLRKYGMDRTWLNSFFVKRPEYMKQYLAEEFGLNVAETVMLYNGKEEAGTIRINTITPQMENGSWSGVYFTDYPITVTAVPKEGYRFVGWTGGVLSEEETIEVQIPVGGIKLTAEFEKE